MKPFIAILAAIVLIGGGYYFYTQTQTPTPTTSVEVTQPIQQTPPLPTTTSSTTGASASTTPAGATSTAGTVKEFNITNTGMVFSEKALTVKKGDRVKITYKNGGGTHDLRIDGYTVGTKVLTAGQSETFEFVADKSGSFEFYCSVGNHRAMGMKGTMTVQ